MLAARAALRMRLFSALGVALLGLAGCAQFTAVSSAVFMMSPEQERALGAKLQDQIAGRYKLDQNPDIVSYVRDLGNKLWIYSAKGDIAPQFFVIEDPDINAFTLPGGAVYVQTGVIMAASDEAEFAAVLAHELGHVARRHGAAALSRLSGMQAAEQLAVGGDAGQANQQLSRLATQSVLMHYSREDEDQADAIAVATLDRAGYDPEALRSFFATLRARYGDEGSGPVSNFFAEHPPTNDRMAHVEALIQELKDPPLGRPVTQLQAIQAALRSGN